MKKFLISALVLLIGSLCFTSCTTVPQDQPTTTVPQDINARRHTTTYSK